MCVDSCNFHLCLQSRYRTTALSIKNSFMVPIHSHTHLLISPISPIPNPWKPLICFCFCYSRMLCECYHPVFDFLGIFFSPTCSWDTFFRLWMSHSLIIMCSFQGISPFHLCCQVYVYWIISLRYESFHISTVCGGIPWFTTDLCLSCSFFPCLARNLSILLIFSKKIFFIDFSLLFSCSQVNWFVLLSLLFPFASFALYYSLFCSFCFLRVGA